MRASHTTVQNKAKCLNYRNGKRCGRVARTLVSFTDHLGQHTQPMCEECAAATVAIGGTIRERSPKGFIVHEGGWGGWVQREYKGIPPDADFGTGGLSPEGELRKAALNRGRP